MHILIGVVLPYVAVVLFLVGAGYRVMTWTRAPRKLNWKLYPAPHGLVGEGRYILEEWASFKTLFRNNRTVWLGSYLFHLALVGLILWFVLFLMGVSLSWLVRIGSYVLFGSSIYLVLVRVCMPQVRSMSTAVEYFNLFLFALISFTAVSLLGEGIGSQTRAYFLGLLTFHPVSPPSSNVFLLNLFLLEFALAYLPFGKMFHMASKYFAYHRIRWLNPYEVTHGSR
jgi:nitrate reductase gamma subunit